MCVGCVADSACVVVDFVVCHIGVVDSVVLNLLESDRLCLVAVRISGPSSESVSDSVAESGSLHFTRTGIVLYVCV